LPSRQSFKLEAVPADLLRRVADPTDADGNGLGGRVGLMEDRTRGRRAVGRFGWKADRPRLQRPR
jgi:CxxC motif-containing protein (DUF1111 family)